MENNYRWYEDLGVLHERRARLADHINAQAEEIERLRRQERNLDDMQIFKAALIEIANEDFLTASDYALWLAVVDAKTLWPIR